MVFAPKAQSFHRTKEVRTPIYLVRKALLSKAYINECTGLKQSLFYTLTQQIRDNCCSSKNPCYMWVGSHLWSDIALWIKLTPKPTLVKVTSSKLHSLRRSFYLWITMNWRWFVDDKFHHIQFSFQICILLQTCVFQIILIGLCVCPF